MIEELKTLCIAHNLHNISVTYYHDQSSDNVTVFVWPNPKRLGHGKGSTFKDAFDEALADAERERPQ